MQTQKEREKGREILSFKREIRWRERKRVKVKRAKDRENGDKERE